MKKILALGSMLAISAAASADIQISSATFGPSSVPFGGVVALDKFDDNGGLHVLKSITFIYDVSMRASVIAESFAGPQVITVGVSGSTNASDGLLFNLGGGIFETADSPVLNDGDIYDFGTIKGIFLDSFSTANAIFFPLYTGAGQTFDVNYSGTGIFGIVGGGNAILDIFDFEAEGTISVIYDYNVIPAPGALALVGLAGLVARRRRN
ncbi:MAG: choice-of-anchor E domain-containing protein [Phycisphaeraceae bacterium]|nr:choice-of-anchor E domain-containing protein [Phycisphaeraceae bacterium]